MLSLARSLSLLQKGLDGRCHVAGVFALEALLQQLAPLLTLRPLQRLLLLLRRRPALLLLLRPGGLLPSPRPLRRRLPAAALALARLLGLLRELALEALVLGVPRAVDRLTSRARSGLPSPGGTLAFRRGLPPVARGGRNLRSG